MSYTWLTLNFFFGVLTLIVEFWHGISWVISTINSIYLVILHNVFSMSQVAVPPVWFYHCLERLVIDDWKLCVRRAPLVSRLLFGVVWNIWAIVVSPLSFNHFMSFNIHILAEFLMLRINELCAWSDLVDHHVLLLFLLNIWIRFDNFSHMILSKVKCINWFDHDFARLIPRFLYFLLRLSVFDIVNLIYEANISSLFHF
jgi:hypothetical protein